MNSAVLSFFIFGFLISSGFATGHEEGSCQSQWVNNDHSGCGVTSKKGDDVYEALWVRNMDIAKETFNADFLVHMQNGSLDAFRFVKFTLQDILYLQVVTNMLKEVSEMPGQPDDLREFITGRYRSYKAFLQSWERDFSLADTKSIQPTPAIEKYLTSYKNVMNTEKDTIYFTVALLPCSRLWVWLAQNLKMQKNNAYIQWKIDNIGGHPEKYRPILNKYLNTTEKAQKANDIFRMQMQNEHDFFSTS
uniref:Uncharacterized LOC111194306 n=1 Tax=Astyanax mexicanus TaxID=7994 RepID=A0A3B1JZF2_ASTMX